MPPSATADASKKLLAASPLVQDNQKIVPSITRVFRKDQTMYVYFEVYDPTMDETQDAELDRRGRVAAGCEQSLFVAAAARVEAGHVASGVAPFAFQIPLANSTRTIHFPGECDR